MDRNPKLRVQGTLNFAIIGGGPAWHGNAGALPD
jgi:hypothetical protein